MSNRDFTDRTEEAALALFEYEGGASWLSLSPAVADGFRARAKVCIDAADRADSERQAGGSMAMGEWAVLDSRHGIRPTSGRLVERNGRPECSKHGAMLRVHKNLRMYRCLSDDWTCNIGAVHKEDQ